ARDLGAVIGAPEGLAAVAEFFRGIERARSDLTGGRDHHAQPGRADGLRARGLEFAFGEIRIRLGAREVQLAALARTDARDTLRQAEAQAVITVPFIDHLVLNIPVHHADAIAREGGAENIGGGIARFNRNTAHQVFLALADEGIDEAQAQLRRAALDFLG